MLEVTEKQVHHWKKQADAKQEADNYNDELKSEAVIPKDEYLVEYLE
jgi:hypothetical protein